MSISDSAKTGSLPRWDLAPMDYGYALDAVMSMLMVQGPSLVRCGVPALAVEVRQRLPQWAEGPSTRAALWVEPLVGPWQAELESLSAGLKEESTLYVVASRPLARMLPERREWPGEPLGLRPGGLRHLRRALRGRGFIVESDYGLHTLIAVGLNLFGGQLARWGRPDLGDRLGFAARLRYCTAGPMALLSTVALWVTRRSRA